eukprot:CAMPEP_0181139746 /NCGR_PEP_ID=MMETSP1071-20121207/34945_1 /TAXON_ID=35127 /ORGANISM="Thalassiosira sp., Strain NH16" /LENGTH=103 /DNA_ID=CAMNT_0023226671 /DNA_START=469 /DNA_END=776 /DNA_ORIENTATION=+
MFATPIVTIQVLYLALAHLVQLEVIPGNEHVPDLLPIREVGAINDTFVVHVDLVSAVALLVTADAIANAVLQRKLILAVLDAHLGKVQGVWWEAPKTLLRDDL